MSLEKTLKELAEKRKNENRIDWTKRREWWIDRVRVLYKLINGWMEPYEKQDFVSISYTSKKIVEKQLGGYDTKVMNLEFPGSIIVLDPVAAMVIAAYGRIDVYKKGYKQKSLLLVLKGEDRASSKWELCTREKPQKGKILTKLVFETMIDKFLQNA